MSLLSLNPVCQTNQRLQNPHFGAIKTKDLTAWLESQGFKLQPASTKQADANIKYYVNGSGVRVGVSTRARHLERGELIACAKQMGPDVSVKTIEQALSGHKRK